MNHLHKLLPLGQACRVELNEEQPRSYYTGVQLDWIEHLICLQTDCSGFAVDDPWTNGLAVLAPFGYCCMFVCYLIYSRS